MSAFDLYFWPDGVFILGSLSAEETVPALGSESKLA